MSEINLYNMCNLEFMKTVPDNYYDLGIVDPPYGININHNIGRRKGEKSSNHKKVLWDSEPPKQEYFNELFRVTKNQIIWGANHFIDKMAKNSSCWLMWNKGFSEKVTFAQFELAWTSFDTTCKKFDKNPNQKIKIHPTQKPVNLYKWLLNNYAKKGDKILDTHFGSLSIGIACHDLGFDLDACELDKDYFEAGKKRLDEHRSQGQFFIGE